jgi:hypothetical protein
MSGAIHNQSDWTSGGSQANTLDFLMRQFTGKMFTITPCIVQTVSPAGTGVGIGAVSVQPAINQIDGAGNATPHGIINNVPYFRVQGGANGIVCDPQVNDPGILVTCNRDISTFKTSRAVSNPGSFRQFDAADSFYFGASLGEALTQWIEFTSNQIIINATSSIVFQIGGTAVNTITSGGQSSTGTITNNGHRVDSSHLHGGVTTGSGDTGAPL